MNPFVNDVLADFLLLVKGPILNPQMIWTIAPLIVVTLAMTF